MGLELGICMKVSICTHICVSEDKEEGKRWEEKSKGFILGNFHILAAGSRKKNTILQPAQ